MRPDAARLLVTTAAIFDKLLFAWPIPIENLAEATSLAGFSSAKTNIMFRAGITKSPRKTGNR